MEKHNRNTKIKRRNRLDFLKKILPFIFVLSLVILILVYKDRDNRLKSKYDITTGKVINCWIAYRGGINIDMEFYVKSTRYEAHKTLYHVNYILIDTLKNKSLPIAYFIDNPKINAILMVKKDFDSFGLSLPDSLLNYNKYISND